VSQRLLLSVGIFAIAAAFLMGTVAVATGAAGVSMMGWLPASSSQSISMDKAERSVQSFLDRTGDRDLKIDELMEFEQNFYALIKEQSTGIGAFELLVNKSTAAVSFEPGPDMMWNTKYGMMGQGGMMGGFRSIVASGAMTVGSDQAVGIAQSWLDGHLAGDSAGTPDAFYGYYTFHFEKGGQITGMLSVNGYSGQVWFHTWHGAFVQARDFGA
jgi:urease beta subunit